MSTKTPITVAHGDGIGPEIMNATLQILEAAGAALEIETIEIGEKVYLRGNTAGIDPSSWDSLLRTKVFLKAPITTPQTDQGQSQPDQSGGAGTPTQTTPAQPNSGGGAAPPQDTETNDTPPPSGSPAERFEKFCEENPGAC